MVGDGAVCEGSGRAPTRTTTLIPHTGGDLSRVGKSSSVRCLKVTCAYVCSLSEHIRVLLCGCVCLGAFSHLKVISNE